ncbi:MAG TPA: hypothetical protein PLC54_07710, partial [Spirochaetales bacterium]|nr:hypothetical protein [Spirochaetales bacterium]
MRIEIRFAEPSLDGRARSLSVKLSRRTGRQVGVAVIDVVLPGAPVPADRAARVLSDPAVQLVRMDSPAASDTDMAGWSYLVEIAWRPGVTDTLAITARQALKLDCGQDYSSLTTARQFLLYGQLDENAATQIAASLHNPLIQSATLISSAEWNKGTRAPASYPAPSVHDNPQAQVVPVAGLNDAQLDALSKERLLALSLAEMQAVRAYFADPTVKAQRKKAGLPEDATDVEIEMIAQTWSEHCKHKIFNATIEYKEAGKETRIINSLFKTYIRATTQDLAPSKPFLRSVFTDNAGVVSFHDGITLCVKA